MIGHYLTSALTRFRRTPVTTGANVLTLALGLACSIAAYGAVAAWRASDQQFSAADRTYVLTQSGDVRSAAPVGHFLRADMPELEAVARARIGDAESSLISGNTAIPMQGAMVEAAFLEIFDFRFLAGDPDTALTAPNSLVLTRSAAERLFGDAPALGQPVRLAGEWRTQFGEAELTVTGVIEDVRQPSHMGAGPEAVTPFEYLWTWPEGLTLEGESWLGTDFVTYLLLPEDGALTAGQLRQRLDSFAERRIPDAFASLGLPISFGAIPLSQVRARQVEVAAYPALAGSIPVTAVMLGLGLLVLGVACFNYSNLLTAQAVVRTREFGIRKVLGAERMRIVTQIWTEAGLLTATAMAVALAALWLARPVIAAQADVDIGPALAANPAFLAIVASLAAGVTIASAAYPGLVATRVRPATAIRAKGAASGSRALLMALVAAQFVGASGLLIGVTILRDQNALLRSAALEASPDPVAVLNFRGNSGIDIRTLAQRLETFPQIVGVSELASLPWASEKPAFGATFVKQGETESNLSAWRMFTGFGLFEVLGIEVLAGRAYDPARDDSAALAENRIVVDRRFAENWGFASPEDAIGQEVQLADFQDGEVQLRPIEIIGVVETAPMYFYGEDTDGMVYRLEPGMDGAYPLVRISASDVAGGIAAIERVWDELAPGVPLNIRFADTLFEQSYRTASRIGLMFAVLSLAALVISAMGLFAMASHVTRGRTHESGVRKTIGATSLDIVALFLRSFSVPVVAANLLAWPIAYFAAQAYLSSFTLRIPMTIWPFLFSFAATLATAWIVVIGQSWRAASVRPARVLKYE